MSPSKDLIFIMSGTNAYDLTLCADNNGECNITSPNYPNDYPNNADIQVEVSLRVQNEAYVQTLF